MFGYKDSMEYYRAAVISGRLNKINCPTLYLASMDDPLHDTHNSYPFKECSENPNLILATTEKGGHCCHLTNRFGKGIFGWMSWIFPVSEWYGEPTAEFFHFIEQNHRAKEQFK